MRKSWNEYFMDLVLNAVTHSIYDRVFVGCVLVNSNNRIASIGYSGAINSNPHCDRAGHTLCGKHHIITIHVEMNASLYCAEGEIAAKGRICYVAHFPCLNCMKSLIQAGISKIYYHEACHVDEYAIELLGRNSIEHVQV